jgi:uncharacterized DUF497 family protein
MRSATLEWDPAKDQTNRTKHGVRLADAQDAFLDPHRLIFADVGHGGAEERWFCLGLVGGCVMTVRFTWRDGRIRLIGAGYWRKGRNLYERHRG